MNIKESYTFSDKEAHPEELVDYSLNQEYFECEGKSGLKLRIYFISNEILRFRYAVEGYFMNDFSYALSDKHNFGAAEVKIEESEKFVHLHTQSIICRIAKHKMKITILNKNGIIICEDEKGFHWEKHHRHGGNIVFKTRKIQDKEAFYGLGDKPTDLKLNGGRFKNWGTDEYGYNKGTDPLYKNIPFFYGLHHDIGYGIFMDNSFKSYFDFGHEREKVMSFWAQGGEMNYYFIAGPELMDVCKRYTLLTGTPDMPPMWALGYQQCKWSYYPESEVRAIASKMRKLNIPCDSIYLDIDYMDGFRCFTWDKEKFPDPKKMVSDLLDDGFKTMVIIDPGIKKDKDYPIFNEGLEKGYFCRHIDGPYVEGKVWPGECYFPDFTKPEVREWWAGLYKELIEEIGVAGVWNDMNEPAIFEVESKSFPPNVVHNYDGNITSHRKAHNVYGMQMARATYEGVKRHNKGKRGLIITRSGYSGLQRYSSVWTGDNIASWEHIWIADVQAQRLAISGVSFCGSDIGGFIGSPSPELMIRWIQLGIFHPFCRVHSSGDHGEQEPWSFGEECTFLFRKYVELRYQLLPYFYTSFYQYHKEGTPMLRPISFYDQKNKDTINKDHEFLCGDHLLVAPVVEEKATSKKVYLPKGDWFNYWTDEVLEGSQTYEIDAPLEKIPLFVKAGAIIPNYPIQQYVGEKEFEEISLHVYFKEGVEKSFLYEDAHDGYDYEQGAFNYSRFILKGETNRLEITKESSGDYIPPYRHFLLKLKALPFKTSAIEIDGESQNLDAQTEVKVPVSFNKIVLL